MDDEGTSGVSAVPLRLGFLASHNGNNMRAIVEACELGQTSVTPRLVISNNGDSSALAWAREHGLMALHISRKTAGSLAASDAAIASALTAAGVNLVILAGYMRLLGPETLARFSGHILNVHPALLPKFGGKGMYGEHVHRAVLASGDKISGVSIHIVTAEYDEGPLLGQAEVPVETDDTVETLARRVQAREITFFPEIIEAIAKGEIDLDAVAASL